MQTKNDASEEIFLAVIYQIILGSWWNPAVTQDTGDVSTIAFADKEKFK